MEIKATYDKSVHAGYIFSGFKHGRVDRTIEVQEGVLLDVDRKGRILGIELLNPSGEFLDEADWRK